MTRMKKKIEDEINDFLNIWNVKELISFLNNIIPLCELYDVDENDDWVEKELKENSDHIRNVRLIRTVYLLSKIAENHSGLLVMSKIHHKNLWKRLEKEVSIEETPN